MYFVARSPAPDEMLTIEPPPAAIIGSITDADAEEHADLVDGDDPLVVGDGVVDDRDAWPMPALLTSTSSPPKRSTPCATTASHASSSDDVVADERHAVAELGGERLAQLGEHVGDDDLGALGREQAHLGLALPPRATGHDRHLAVQPTHADPPVLSFRCGPIGPVVTDSLVVATSIAKTASMTRSTQATTATTVTTRCAHRPAVAPGPSSGTAATAAVASPTPMARHPATNSTPRSAPALRPSMTSAAGGDEGHGDRDDRAAEPPAGTVGRR